MDIGRLITFDMFPGDVLLEIFYFYVGEDISMYERFDGKLGWMKLAHVCRGWRSVIFQSPRRLNLRLLCTSKTRTRDMLDIWPPLPLIIDNTCKSGRLDNVIAALEHNDRVCQIDLQCLKRSELEFITSSAAMDKPFPELTNLYFAVDKYDIELESILPDSFLGGTTPRLRSLNLCIPFPGLPKLLLSATRLVHLLHPVLVTFHPRRWPPASLR